MVKKAETAKAFSHPWPITEIHYMVIVVVIIMSSSSISISIATVATTSNF